MSRRTHPAAYAVVLVLGALLALSGCIPASDQPGAPASPGINPVPTQSTPSPAAR